MTEQNPSSPPIACTLTGTGLLERLASIAALTRDALVGYERRGVVLDLRFAITAAERVREMVLKERDCCAFLTFDLREVQQEVRLTITAPESARKAADILFQQFVGSDKQTPTPVAASEGAAVDENA
jgi:SLT domain-containing protein